MLQSAGQRDWLQTLVEAVAKCQALQVGQLHLLQALIEEDAQRQGLQAAGPPHPEQIPCICCKKKQ